VGSELKLIVRSGPLGDRVILLADERLAVGRGPDQDLCIPDRKISSAHALLEPCEGGYRIRDLGSTNGTYVNGALVEGVRRLALGDEIVFGSTRVLFTDEEPETARWPEPRPEPPSVEESPLGAGGPTQVATPPPQLPGDDETGLEADLGLQTVKFNLQEVERGLLAPDVKAEQLQRRLQVLYRVTVAARRLPVEHLLEQATALLLDVIDADRGAFYLREAGTNRLREVALRTKKEKPAAQAGVSRGLLNQALQGGEAIITRDAQEDDRFAAHQSIYAFNIRSALAVPLLAPQAPVQGVLLLDKRDARRPFGEEDLQLAVMVAQQVSAALATAQLIGQLTRTNEELQGARDEILRWNQELEQKVEVRTREVQALNDQKDALLGMVAHDLRTPLTGLLGFAEVAQADLEAGSDRLAEDLEVIRATAVEMHDLLSDLLDVSKIEAGKVEITKRTTDLAALLDEGRRRYEMWAGAKDIAFRLKCGELPPVKCDARRIQQVLNNLVSNAVKFSRKGGTITLSAKARDDAIEVSVVDTGQGIDAADLEKLFKQFEQGAAQATGGERGTGLGLAIAKKLVELHGGTIGVESKRGVGSKFTFRLPL
jgi:signal transduction histidine kinase